jgi:hypothetical protein
VSRLFLIVAVAAGLCLAGCGDSFNPPELPDLKKTPYDFSTAIPPFSGGDMHVGDLGVTD